MESNIEIKNQLLTVYSQLHPETGRPVINWEFGKNVNAYFLIGILEDIKLDLLACIENESDEAEENA